MRSAKRCASIHRASLAGCCDAGLQQVERAVSDPDHGRGAAEWAIVGLLGIAFLACSTASSMHFRRHCTSALAGASSPQ